MAKYDEKYGLTFDGQGNQNWGLTLHIPEKVPLTTNSIFDTYEHMLAYVNNPTSSAIQGLTLAVVSDTDTVKNGIYYIKEIGTKGEDGSPLNNGEVVKLSTNADSQATADEVYNALTAYTATTKVTLDNIDSDITDIKADVTGITADITGIKADITGITEDVTGIKADITDIKADITGITEDVTDIYAKLDENAQAHQTLDNKITTGLTNANSAIAAIKSAYVNAAEGEGNVKTELVADADGNGKTLKVTLEWQEF